MRRLLLSKKVSTRIVTVAAHGRPHLHRNAVPRSALKDQTMGWAHTGQVLCVASNPNRLHQAAVFTSESVAAWNSRVVISDAEGKRAAAMMKRFMTLAAQTRLCIPCRLPPTTITCGTTSPCERHRGIVPRATGFFRLTLPPED